MNLLKRLIIGVVFITMVFPLFSSQLRVLEMGNDWLAPDIYVDIIMNPSNINNIDKNFVYNNTYVRYVAIENYEINPYNLDSNLEASIFHKFDILNIGIIFNNTFFSHHYYLPHSERNINKFTLLSGFKLNTAIDCGIKFEIGNGYFRYPHFQYFASLGIDIKTNDYNWGFVFGGGNGFGDLINYRYKFSILPEYNLENNFIVRGLNILEYLEEDLSHADVPVYFENYHLGECQVSNKTGISLLKAANNSNYILGLSNDWIMIDDNSYSSISDTINRRKQIMNHLALSFGVEIPFIFDWLKLRFKYTLFDYFYNKIQNDEINSSNNAFGYYFSTEHTLEFFSGENSLGFGVDISDDFILDLSINDLFSYYHDFSSYEQGYKFDTKVQFNITYKY